MNLMKMNLLSLYQSLLLIYTFFVGVAQLKCLVGIWRSVYRFVCVGQTLTRSDLKQFTNGNHLKAGSSSGVLVCDIEFTIWISHSWIFKHEIKTSGRYKKCLWCLCNYSTLNLCSWSANIAWTILAKLNFIRFNSTPDLAPFEHGLKFCLPHFVG